MKTSNPKEFWKIINQNHVDGNINCSVDKFLDYFKTINSFSYICYDNEFINQMEEHLDNTETVNHDINSLITE